MKEACKKFLAYFHDFLQTNLNLKFEFLHRKIIDDDVSKFMKKKAEFICEDILKRLPEKFRHYIKHFLSKNAKNLFSYRP